LHTTAFPSGVMGVPVEVIESVAPLIVYRREIAQDTGGAGQFRGGCGQHMEVGTRTDRPYNLGPIFDRTRVPAEGYEGGSQGALGAIIISDGRALQDKSQVGLSPDERFTLQLPGGGGYYDPYTRDVAAVFDDVLDGFVSIAAARSEYGVVIDPETRTLDEHATAALRGAR